MKYLYLIQPLFLGDILFCIRIAEYYAQQGYRVIFPIQDEYKIIRDRIVLPRGVMMPLTSEEFPHKNSFFYASQLADVSAAQGDYRYHESYFEHDGQLFLALASSWRKFQSGGSMPGKYEVAKVPLLDWHRAPHIVRDPAKESALIAQLGVAGKRFVLINETGRTNVVPVPASGEVVRLTKLEGYELFDWIGIIELADEIITIDTALVLLIEVVKPRARLQVYSRYIPSDNFRALRGALHLEWHYADTVDHLIPSDLWCFQR